MSFSVYISSLTAIVQIFLAFDQLQSGWCALIKSGKFKKHTFLAKISFLSWFTMFRNYWVEEVTIKLVKTMNLIQKYAFSNNFFVFF